MIDNILEIKKENLLAEIQKIKDDGYRLVTTSCVDLGSEFMIYYHFDKENIMKHFKLVSKKQDEIPSISGIYLAGAISENEMKDLFGMKISGMVLDYGGKFMIASDSGNAPFAVQSEVEGE